MAARERNRKDFMPKVLIVQLHISQQKLVFDRLNKLIKRLKKKQKVVV